MHRITIMSPIDSSSVMNLQKLLQSCCGATNSAVSQTTPWKDEFGVTYATNGRLCLQTRHETRATRRPNVPDATVLEWSASRYADTPLALPAHGDLDVGPVTIGEADLRIVSEHGGKAYPHRDHLAPCLVVFDDKTHMLLLGRPRRRAWLARLLGH